MEEILEFLENIGNFFETFFSGGTSELTSALTQEVYKMIMRTPANTIMESPALQSLYSYMIPVGLMLIMIAFFSKLTEMAIDDQLNVDKILKEVIVLIIVLMLMDNALSTDADNTGWIQKFYNASCEITDSIIGETISNYGEELAEDWTELIGDGIDIDDSDEDRKWYEVIKNAIEDLWNAVWGLLMSLVLLLLSGIISIFVFGVGVYRAVKIGIYIILSPIGIATAYDKGAVGLKYFKKILILFLQEPVLMVSIYLLYTANSGGSGPFGPNLLTTLLIAGMMVGAVLSSEKRAKELLG